VVADRLDALDSVWDRLGLPRAVRRSLGASLGHLHLLVTGLLPHERAFLRAHDDPRTSLVLGEGTDRADAATVSGVRAGLEALADLAGESGLAELGVAVHAALGIDVPPAPTVLGGRLFGWGERTFVMGVLNVTPDSFSDGGRFPSVDAAVQHAEALIAAGADLLDVGGESTRPGAEPVPEEVERDRVLPIVERLAGRVPLSVDTRKAGVARAALAAGAAMVNDVSALQHDPELASVVARARAGLCVMHMQGTPRTMQDAPRYEDVMAEVLQTLGTAVETAVAAGVARPSVWVDPGIGFGKTPGHNLFLLRHLRELRILDAPVVVGTSRKRFLGELAGGRAPGERLPGTLASNVAAAVLGGADVVRVHDVAEVREALTVADAVARAREGGSAWVPPGPVRP
jgi:dihydropteroate synthase